MSNGWAHDEETRCARAQLFPVVSWSGCQQQTWESATAAGQQTVQQANDATAEQIFLVAVHNAEAFGLEDRRVAVSLSQLAQVYAG